MTLPKNITDAIDKYARAIAGACANFDDGTPNICRAALEAAIADHIADAGKKVEPPTDAEVEAWAEQFKTHTQPEGFAEKGKWIRADSDEGVRRYELVRDRAVAIMRRARAPLERLRERVLKVQAEIEANAKNFDTMATAGYGLQVLKWIDEERGAGR